jgi:ParB family chromosome partitioning protein
MATDKYLTYYGDLKAALGSDGTLLFVTVHPEGQPTALYRLGAEKLALEADALPCGGQALAVDQEAVWIAGSDGRLYQGSVKGGKPKAVGAPLPAPATKLALLADNRLACLVGTRVVVVSRKDGAVRQELALPEAGSSLAADPTGQWLVAGTVKGMILVFDGEGKGEFALSEAQKVHEGAVTALLFEQDELRFFSAGADQKLFSTHARGKLEPEERGRGVGHTDVVNALLWAPGDRFLSGSRDKTIKTWPRTGNVRPATLKDGVGAVVDLALVKVHTRTQVVAACDDNTLRFFLLDAAGKFGDATVRAHGFLAWAGQELAQAESGRREAALKALAECGDVASIELLAGQIDQDADHALRLLATQLLGDSGHARAAGLLEPRLKHADEAVRVAALAGLRRLRGEQDLQPLDLALKAEKADVGRLAVQGLEALARKDDQALARLVAALNANPPEVRQAALASLEQVHDPQSPEADLLGLHARQADLRRLALVRLYQRQLLGQARVRAALRWRAEDGNADVRRTAFLLSLHTRPRLVEALRAGDPELQRQLAELDSAPQEAPAGGKKGKAARARDAEPAQEGTRRTPRKGPRPADLESADYEPLLQATASRALDTCLRGARGLAVLGDSRAFGLLLQLSREENAAARVEVCRALAALDDPRSLNRLRSLLYDTEAAVRDAAFSALAHIHQDVPLLAAESGLSAAFEDVRRRGLQMLIAQVRKTPPTLADEPTWQLLVRALNDSFPGVRAEAFKAALNLHVGGGDVKTLRFVLQSIHADVRREVLTEVMAQAAQPWAWNLLLEFYNDHDPALRREAFDFATRKNKDLPPLEAALLSQYADVRKPGVEGLTKKHTKPAQALLVRALADPEKEVRQLALEALVGADAQAALTEALRNPHADVRVGAARALARHGLPTALTPLRALTTVPEPEEPERKADWLALAEQALEGLAELGDPAALTDLLPLLDSKHAALRQAAARALVWVSRPASREAARHALQHADLQVKYRAALALAYLGDPLVGSLVFSAEAGQVLTAEERLAAALTLGPAGEDQVVVFLDDQDEAIRGRALLLLMLLELRHHIGTPARCLACLSSRLPRVRLTAARALEHFADPDAFLRFVAGLVNDRGEEQAWIIPRETVEMLADLLAFGEPQTRARTAGLLRHLEADRQDAWDQAWLAHAARFGAEVAALAQQGAGRRPPPSQHTPEQLRELAFGAYIGLVREQGGAAARGQRAAAGPQVVRVRQTALGRVLSLAQAHPSYKEAAIPVLVQALGDPNQPVRLQAFEHLLALGMDPAALGAEALEAGHTDLGVKALEVLTAGAAAGRGEAVLEQVMRTRSDELAVEAAKLLAARRGPVAVAESALEAASEDLRQQAVGWLAAEYDRDAAAGKVLRQALASRYQKVRRRAALELATKKDPAAFDALVRILQETQDAGKLRRAAAALVTLGDRRAPGVLLDRLENDPAGTAPADDLLQSAGAFRLPESADRLLALAEKHPKWRKAALGAVVVVSGYDQPIGDPEEEGTDRRWLEKQFPRHDAVLARLLERCFALGDTALLRRLMPGARWAPGKDVEPVLVTLTTHADDALRQTAVEALGWRLRKRQGNADALLRSLRHRDSVTQFLAAEGLARAGRGEGLSVLLAAVEFLNRPPLPQRAVLALGELADARALDLLLKLANDPAHVLQGAAAEALGHLGRSEKAPEIFKLLERFGRGSDAVAANALRGLRWFNTHAGWQLVRERAADRSLAARPQVVELLGYNDDPATRDLLKKLLASDVDWPVFDIALHAARRLWGPDSLEPDYALLQNGRASHNAEPFKEALGRVAERGEAGRLFAILPHCPEDVQEALAICLVNRQPLPVAEALRALDDPDERAVQLAAEILGRAGPAETAACQAVPAVLKKWRGRWEERRRTLTQVGRLDGPPLEKTTGCLQGLLWAAGRLGVADDERIAAASERPGDPVYRPARLQAVGALASGTMTDAARGVLEKAAVDADAAVRTAAADALGRYAPERAGSIAEELLSDQVSFGRLARHEGVDVSRAARQAAGRLHYQGVGLPLLLREGDVATLTAVAGDRGLPEAARLGAVEGLARLARPEAEAELVRLGLSEKEEDELRRAAWRGLRRSRRARKAEAAEGRP